MPNNARHEDRHHRGIWFASDHVGPKLFGSKTIGVKSDRRIPSHGTRRVGPSNFNDLVFFPVAQALSARIKNSFRNILLTVFIKPVRD